MPKDQTPSLESAYNRHACDTDKHILENTQTHKPKTELKKQDMAVFSAKLIK